MSYLDPVDIPELSRAEWQYQAANRPTGFGQYLGAKIKSGFDFSPAGRATEAIVSPGERFGPLPQDTAPDVAAEMGFDTETRRVNEDEWRKLKLERPGLKFSGGGTVEYEQARTAAFDERRYRDSLIQRYQSGKTAYVAGFGAMVLGGLASPENFIPFVGPGVRAAMTARLGVLGGHVAAGAADATIGTVLADALVLPDLANRGEDVGAADLAMDIALGAVTGGLLGAGGGLLEKRKLARKAREKALKDAQEAGLNAWAMDASRQRAGGPPDDPAGAGGDPGTRAAAQAVRIDGVERHADALEAATAAVANDEPVSVGPILADGGATQERFIRAYHGSPHRFDQFSMEHIGTGEGAQAYGHGLYFAESEGVAKNYSEMFNRQIVDANNKRMTELAREMGKLEKPGRYREYTDPKGYELAAEYDRLMEEKLNRDNGSMYAVDLAVSRDELLDWDKPLSEQPAKVREAVNALLKPTAEQSAADDALLAELLSGPGSEELSAAAAKAPLPEMTGAQIYEALSGGGSNSVFGNSPASMKSADRLRAAGIRGIQYLDAGSRAGAEGTRNLVIFDEAAIHIREVNGTAVERPPEPHPSISEAEAAVKQAPPKDGVEDAQRLAKEMGAGDASGLAKKLTDAQEVAAKTSSEYITVAYKGRDTKPFEVITNPSDKDVRNLIKENADIAGDNGAARVMFDRSGNLTHAWQASAAIHGQVAERLGLGDLGDEADQARAAIAYLEEGRVVYESPNGDSERLSKKNYSALYFPKPEGAAVPVAPPSPPIPDDIPEMQEVATMRNRGQLTEADEGAVADADELVKSADAWATAYDTLAGCVVRHG
jgi:hypothetical protein